MAVTPPTGNDNDTEIANEFLIRQLRYTSRFCDGQQRKKEWKLTWLHPNCIFAFFLHNLHLRLSLSIPAALYSTWRGRKYATFSYSLLAQIFITFMLHYPAQVSLLIKLVAHGNIYFLTKNTISYDLWSMRLVAGGFLKRPPLRHIQYDWQLFKSFASSYQMSNLYKCIISTRSSNRRIFVTPIFIICKSKVYTRQIWRISSGNAQIWMIYRQTEHETWKGLSLPLLFQNSAPLFLIMFVFDYQKATKKLLVDRKGIWSVLPQARWWIIYPYILSNYFTDRFVTMVTFDSEKLVGTA